MKKALLTGMSGALIALTSSSAWALNQSEAEDDYVAKHGGDKSDAHAKFNAWEKVLKDELTAKRAVKIDGLGTYAPKEKTGTRQVNGFGGEKTVDSYKLVKKPETTNTDAFIDKFAAQTGMSKADAKTFNDEYIKQVQTTLKKGGTVTMNGSGTYRVGKHPRSAYVNSKGETIVKPAYKDPTFNAQKGTPKQKFTEDAELRGAVN